LAALPDPTAQKPKRLKENINRFGVLCLLPGSMCPASGASRTGSD
jgi:hypothetical protein